MSVVVAVLVGGIEALRLPGDQFALKGRFRNAIGAPNHDVDALGFAIIGLFIATWIGSAVVHRYQGLDELEMGSTGS